METIRSDGSSARPFPHVTWPALGMGWPNGAVVEERRRWQSTVVEWAARCGGEGAAVSPGSGAGDADLGGRLSGW
jgi:hypothetical protein